MIDLFDAIVADLRGRLAWYRGPEIMMFAVIIFSIAFVALLLMSLFGDGLVG